MANNPVNRWDERYSQDEYAYGIEPNLFLREQLTLLTPGAILFPAEGEGRNAVYAATQGWKATAFDISSEGKKKAIKLAAAKGVTIDYHIGTLEELSFPTASFDVIALIYAHFPAEIKSACHRRLDSLLRKGGTLIFEAFSKNHLAYVLKDEKIGGPKDIDTLFSIEEIQNDFPGYTFSLLEETIIQLNEGLYHNGTGSVIRAVAKKQ